MLFFIVACLFATFAPAANAIINGCGRCNDNTHYLPDSDPNVNDLWQPRLDRTDCVRMFGDVGSDRLVDAFNWSHWRVQHFINVDASDGLVPTNCSEGVLVGGNPECTNGCCTKKRHLDKGRLQRCLPKCDACEVLTPVKAERRWKCPHENCCDVSLPLVGCVARPAKGPHTVFSCERDGDCITLNLDAPYELLPPYKLSPISYDEAKYESDRATNQDTPKDTCEEQDICLELKTGYAPGDPGNPAFKIITEKHPEYKYLWDEHGFTPLIEEPTGTQLLDGPQTMFYNHYGWFIGCKKNETKPECLDDYREDGLDQDANNPFEPMGNSWRGDCGVGRWRLDKKDIWPTLTGCYNPEERFSHTALSKEPANGNTDPDALGGGYPFHHDMGALGLKDPYEDLKDEKGEPLIEKRLQGTDIRLGVPRDDILNLHPLCVQKRQVVDWLESLELSNDEKKRIRRDKTTGTLKAAVKCLTDDYADDYDEYCTQFYATGEGRNEVSEWVWSEKNLCWEKNKRPAVYKELPGEHWMTFATRFSTPNPDLTNISRGEMTGMPLIGTRHAKQHGDLGEYGFIKPRALIGGSQALDSELNVMLALRYPIYKGMVMPSCSRGATVGQDPNSFTNPQGDCVSPQSTGFPEGGNNAGWWDSAHWIWEDPEQTNSGFFDLEADDNLWDNVYGYDELNAGEDAEKVSKIVFNKNFSGTKSKRMECLKIFIEEYAHLADCGRVILERAPRSYDLGHCQWAARWRGTTQPTTETGEKGLRSEAVDYHNFTAPGGMHATDDTDVCERGIIDGDGEEFFSKGTIAQQTENTIVSASNLVTKYLFAGMGQGDGLDFRKRGCPTIEPMDSWPEEFFKTCELGVGAERINNIFRWDKVASSLEFLNPPIDMQQILGVDNGGPAGGNLHWLTTEIEDVRSIITIEAPKLPTVFSTMPPLPASVYGPGLPCIRWSPPGTITLPHDAWPLYTGGLPLFPMPRFDFNASNGGSPYQDANGPAMQTSKNFWVEGYRGVPIFFLYLMDTLFADEFNEFKANSDAERPRLELNKLETVFTEAISNPLQDDWIDPGYDARNCTHVLVPDAWGTLPDIDLLGVLDDLFGKTGEETEVAGQKSGDCPDDEKSDVRRCMNGAVNTKIDCSDEAAESPYQTDQDEFCRDQIPTEDKSGYCDAVTETCTNDGLDCNADWECETSIISCEDVNECPSDFSIPKFFGVQFIDENASIYLYPDKRLYEFLPPAHLFYHEYFKSERDVAFFCDFQVPFNPYIGIYNRDDRMRRLFFEDTPYVNAILANLERSSPQKRMEIDHQVVERIRSGCGAFTARGTWVEDDNVHLTKFMIGENAQSRCEEWKGLFGRRHQNPKQLSWRLPRFDYEFLKAFIQCTGPVTTPINPCDWQNADMRFAILPEISYLETVNSTFLQGLEQGCNEIADKIAGCAAGVAGAIDSVTNAMQFWKKKGEDNAAENGDPPPADPSVDGEGNPANVADAGSTAFCSQQASQGSGGDDTGESGGDSINCDKKDSSEIGFIQTIERLMQCVCKGENIVNTAALAVETISSGVDVISATESFNADNALSTVMSTASIYSSFREFNKNTQALSEELKTIGECKTPIRNEEFTEEDIQYTHNEACYNTNKASFGLMLADAAVSFASQDYVSGTQTTLLATNTFLQGDTCTYPKRINWDTINNRNIGYRMAAKDQEGNQFEQGFFKSVLSQQRPGQYGFWCSCEADLTKTTRCREDFCTCQQHIIVTGLEGIYRPMAICKDYGPFKRWLGCYYQARAKACPVLTRDVSIEYPSSTLTVPTYAKGKVFSGERDN